MRKVSIVIPSRQNDGQPCEQRQRQNVLDDVERELSDYYGGCTLVDGIGSWQPSDALVPVREAVTIAYAYAEDIRQADIVALARYVKTELKQDSVLVSVEPVDSVWFV